MKLKAIVRILPVYITVHVHDKEGNFAYKGNPHQFIYGLYKSHANDTVCMANPIDSYHMEITVKEDKK